MTATAWIMQALSSLRSGRRFTPPAQTRQRAATADDPARTAHCAEKTHDLAHVGVLREQALHQRLVISAAQTTNTKSGPATR